MAEPSAQSAAATPRIRTCPCCGLAQFVPHVAASRRACCVRCETTLDSPVARIRSASRTAAIATAALILYPPAILLPIMRIEQLGHHHESSILDGVATLLAEGHLFVGVIVLVCSIILPIAKLAGLLTLSTAGMKMEHHHRAWTHRVIEFTGRWGMLDVLAVAVLVSAVKLGSSVELTAGPGAVAFTVVVLLSLAASAVFDPHAFWENAETKGPA